MGYIAFFGAGSYQQVKISHKGWIEEYLEDGLNIRQDEGTDRIAVGSKTYVKKVIALLGFRAMGRDVKKGGGGYPLRKEAVSYNALLGPEKRDIAQKIPISGVVTMNNQQVVVARPQPKQPKTL